MHAVQEAAAAQLIAVATAAAQEAGISSSSLRNLQRLQSQALGGSPDPSSGLMPEVTKSDAVLRLLHSDVSELNGALNQQQSTWDRATSQLDAVSSGNEQSGATQGDGESVMDDVRRLGPHQPDESWKTSPWTVPSNIASIAVYHQQQDQQQHPKQFLLQQAEQQQQPKQSLLKQQVSDQAPDTPHQFELHHQQLQQQHSVLSTASGIAPDAHAIAGLWPKASSWDQSAANGAIMLQQSTATVTQTDQSGGSLSAHAMLQLSSTMQSDLSSAGGSAMPQLRNGMLGVEQDDAARAAYRQWSDSFEASQVSIALLIAQWLLLPRAQICISVKS